jgi:hypothetical protein
MAELDVLTFFVTTTVTTFGDLLINLATSTVLIKVQSKPLTETTRSPRVSKGTLLKEIRTLPSTLFKPIPTLVDGDGFVTEAVALSGSPPLFRARIVTGPTIR